jgi:hypothetical protein
MFVQPPQNSQKSTFGSLIKIMTRSWRSVLAVSGDCPNLAQRLEKWKARSRLTFFGTGELPIRPNFDLDRAACHLFAGAIS